MKERMRSDNVGHLIEFFFYHYDCKSIVYGEIDRKCYFLQFFVLLIYDIYVIKTYHVVEVQDDDIFSGHLLPVSIGVFGLIPRIH